jgi:magnesium transporter
MRQPEERDIQAVVDEVRERLAEGKIGRAAELVAALHPADGADVLSELETSEQLELIDQLKNDDAADVLAWMNLDEQAEIAAALSAGELSDILDEMEPDDAADVLGELSPQQAQAALAEMEESEEVEELLEHADDSAGGIMLPHVVALRSYMTAEDAIALMRRLKPEEDSAYYLFVTDDAERLLGVLSLRQLIIADPATSLRTIMNPSVISISVDADQEEAARQLSHYGLMALPTVDEDGRLVGVITADDIIDVIEEEATEDIYRLAGLDKLESVERSIFLASRRRLTWLFVNLPTAMLAGAVVAAFQSTIDQVAVLAVFMPIVAGMGGNAGIQTLTLIVRSIALGEIDLRDSWRALGRESLIGMVNGLCFGLAIGLIGLAWQRLPILGLVAGVAMLANMLAAAIAGTLVPLGLKLFGADPALASGVIVTTFTDVTGYGCYLGLATLLLRFFPH